MKKCLFVVFVTVVLSVSPLTFAGVSVDSSPDPIFAEEVVTFELTSLPGGSEIISEYVEAGFSFSAPLGISHKDNDTQDGINPYNGSAYLRTSSEPYQATLTIQEVNGSRFGIFSIDLADYSVHFSQSSPTFVGYRNGVEVGRNVFSTNSIDFETYQLSDDFRDVDSVEVLEIGYAIDNVHLQVVPEPASMLLFGIGGLLLRKRKA